MEKKTRKQIIIKFLTQCNNYGVKKIFTYKNIDNPDLDIIEKLKKWETYIEFNKHAISELETDTLDDWFDD